MLGQLRGARERTLTFLDRTKGRDFSAYHWRHPFVGMLNFYEWFEMIAAISCGTQSKWEKLENGYQNL